MKKDQIASFYETYFRRMVLLANEYVKDLALAQDLAQDVFEHLFKKPEETIFNAEAYLMTATRNRCLDHIKTKKLRSEHHQKITALSSDTYFEQALEYTELEDFLMHTINALPSQQKIIFKRSRIQGKSNAEIAEEMTLSKRTVETQISKALKTLRNKLSDFQNLILSIL